MKNLKKMGRILSNTELKMLKGGGHPYGSCVVNGNVIYPVMCDRPCPDGSLPLCL